MPKWPAFKKKDPRALPWRKMGDTWQAVTETHVYGVAKPPGHAKWTAIGGPKIYGGAPKNDEDLAVIQARMNERDHGQHDNADFAKRACEDHYLKMTTH